ncbi:serine hydrolase domain-containing protein [Halopiger thermotolerans]
MPAHCSRRRFLAGSTALGATVATGCIPDSARATETGSTLAAQDDLETLVDETVRAQLEEHDAAGAVVSVVRDGSIALARGYGEPTFDDDPVTADETPVQVGSISKLLTYTAAMQLVDRGEIAPDDDVNDHLESVSVPNAYDEPVTLAHLATHTAGFELRSRNDTVSRLEHRQSLEDAVGSNQPSRIQPPGERLGYTNYAAALTGQVIADATGSSFREYAETNVFEPLGMDRSTFAPVPDALEDGVRDALVADLPWHSNVPPASGLWSTGTDMARFMLAHLEGGATDRGRILSAEATDEMHRQWFTSHEALDRMAFGFFERTRDDVRLLYHGGSGPGYQSSLVLVPELDLGLFVSFQGAAPGGAASAIREAVLDRYVPVTDADLTPDGRPDRADDLEGTYRAVPIRDHTTYEKGLFTALIPDIDVRIDDDGALVTDADGETRWVEVEPLVFRRVDGRRTLVFHEDDGEITGFSSETQSWAFAPISLADEKAVQAGLAVGTTLVVGSGVLGWPLAAAVRRYRGSPSASGEDARRARWAAGTAGALLFGFVAALVALLLLLPALGRPGLFDRPPRGFGLLFLAPIAAAVATLVAAGYAVRAWREGFWSLLVRVHYTAVVAALAVLLWVFRYWNLLGIPA